MTRATYELLLGALMSNRIALGHAADAAERHYDLLLVGRLAGESQLNALAIDALKAEFQGVAA